jgi:hypothetical protein
MKVRGVALSTLFVLLASIVVFSFVTETTAARPTVPGAPAFQPIPKPRADSLVPILAQANAQSLSADTDSDGLSDDVERNGWDNARVTLSQSARFR